MRRTFFSIITVLLAVSTFAQVPTGYQTEYASLVGVSGVNLFDAISSIAAEGYTSHSYRDLWTYFWTTDAENGVLVDPYSSCTWSSTRQQCGNYSNVCDCYNREHSLPKSWFGGSDSNAPGTDLFHLMPTDGKVNGQRSNYAFGECAAGTRLSAQARGKLGNSTFSGYTSVGKVFEPDDEWKGDFARNYFGMLVRYGKSYALNQADGGQVMFSNTGKSITASNHYGLTAYSVALLMAWHRADDVSLREQHRNNGIQQTQGNRNPFIDCPVLAEYFWGEKAGQAVELQDLVDCGCVSDSYLPTSVENLHVAPFPSLTFTVANGAVYMTCLPDDATVWVFTADGQLIESTRSYSPEMIIPLEKGLYMILVSAQGQKQSVKLMVD
ncbi:MAG: endonuclease [Paludibacteraceae bacterium]|nr:endonuclease [Paludibacteraceae bacterium]